MNRFYWTNATLLLGVTLCQTALLAQGGANDNANKPSAPDVVLSEVCYWPKEGEPEWIELTNISDKAVDLKGWQLLDGQALDFVITEASFSLPPKGYLVVYLDGMGQPISLAKPESWVAHSPKAVVGNLLGDKGGQIALYLPTAVPYEQPEISSYVAWGRSPGSVVADALKATQWSSVSDTIVGTGPDIILGPVKTIPQGGTIALIESPIHWGYKYQHWGIFLPSEANPGETGVAKRGPTLTRYAYDGATTDVAGYINISVVPMEEGVKYQFQVCEDTGCKNIYIDHSGEEFDYLIEKPLPLKSTYFWRARLIYADETVSQWSETRKIVRE